MAHRSMFDFSNKGGGGIRLCVENPTIFFTFFNPSLIVWIQYPVQLFNVMIERTPAEICSFIFLGKRAWQWSCHIAVYHGENIKKTSHFPTISNTPIPYTSPTSYSNTLSKSSMANFCEICGRDYANIKQHNDDLHNPHKQPVSCPICGKIFASKNSMRVHKSTLHRDQP